jgi:hypothetical protein
VRRRLTKRERMVRSSLWVCQCGRLPDLTEYYSNSKNCQEKTSLEQMCFHPCTRSTRTKLKKVKPFTNTTLWSRSNSKVASETGGGMNSTPGPTPPSSMLDQQMRPQSCCPSSGISYGQLSGGSCWINPEAEEGL